MGPPPTTYVFVVLEQQPVLGAVTLVGFESFDLAGMRFHAASSLFSLGEYSWLRESADTIIGLRWDLDPGTDLLLAQLPNHPYVRKLPQTNSVEFYFGQGRTFDPDQSIDHDIGEQRLYSNASGVLCCGFDDMNLTTAERNGVWISH